MTVEAITRKAGPYDYTSGAAYPFAFKVFNKTDVYVVVTENEVESIITLDANYTVTLNDDQDNNPGGYVSLITQYGSHCKITIGSGVPYNQGLVLTNKGGFYPDTLNRAYDKLTILCQQLLEQVSRCIKVNLSSSLSAEDYKAQLEDTANDAAESAASAALSAQDAASSAAVAAETANEALTKANTAVETSDEALASIIPGVNQAIENLHIPDMVSDNVDDKIEALDLDTQIYNEVVSAISGVTIPGLSPETIAGALGYTPYDAETNSKDFATSAEVGQAIQQAVDAIPEQVNADWEATEGPAQILNKPVIGGVPVGAIEYFAREEMPQGYLLAAGQAVGRATYPDLFAAIGTMYGEGDGETTFNLPNLIGRFAEGSEMPGTVKEAGLPNIKGASNIGGNASKSALAGGALKQVRYQQNWILNGAASDINDLAEVELDASLYNPIYGNSNTVQPPALTLLPCIKAFDATVNTGLINVTELAQDVAGKAERSQVANLAMPSDSYVDLTLGQPDVTEYTAPGDGWVKLEIYCSDSVYQVGLYSRTSGFTAPYVLSYSPGSLISTFLPVRKGDVFIAYFHGTITRSTFRFFYAEGSQP